MLNIEFGNAELPKNKDRLVVYFLDNTVIGKGFNNGNWYESDVFQKTIEKINPLIVYKSGNVICDGEPLVSTSIHLKYPNESYKLSNGFYLNTHSSTQRKKVLLDQISDKLKLGLRVVLIPVEGK